MSDEYIYLHYITSIPKITIKYIVLEHFFIFILGTLSL